MKQIYKILEEIKNESSSNKKLEILKKYSDNKLLKKVLYYTYNPLVNFYIKDYVESFSIVFHEDDVDDNRIFRVLDDLSKRIISGNEAKTHLKSLTHFLCYESRSVLRKIIDRDLNVGVSIKSINKVFPKLIHEVPYCGCSLFEKIKNIDFSKGAYTQKKSDGTYCSVVYKDDTMKFYTRNGIEFDLNCLKEEFYSIFHNLEYFPYKDFVICGELLITGNDKELERKTGNGLIVSLIKSESTKESLLNKIEVKKKNHYSYDKLSSELTTKIKEWEWTDNHLFMEVFDLVPFEEWKEGLSKKGYEDRWTNIQYVFNLMNKSDIIIPIETEIVYSLEEAQTFYQKMINTGFEGSILKNREAKFENKRSTEQIKLKSEKVADLLCVGYIEGEDKYKGGIGSLKCVSADGLVRVDVPGKSDKMRGFRRVDEDDSSKGICLIENFDCNCYTGKIFAVKFNELIKNKKGEYSLFLPKLESNDPRIDKDVADNFETIINL